MAGKNWDDYTDFELNCLVAESQGLKYETWNNQNVYVTPTHEGVNIQNVVSIYDPCNNPSDAWPVMLESKISPHPYANSDKWFACDVWGKFNSGDMNNPLRAAMIVFLMMNEAEQ